MNTEELDYLCKIDRYETVLEKLPFANISPTVHKILAHSSDLIEIYNNGRVLKDFLKKVWNLAIDLQIPYTSSKRNNFCRQFSGHFSHLIGQSKPYYTNFNVNLALQAKNLTVVHNPYKNITRSSD